MRYFVISDLHANLEATNAIDEDMKARFKPDFTKREGQKDFLLYLGDGVGYCANPNAVLDWITSTANVYIPGDHEKMVNLATNHPAELREDTRWNPLAKESWLWTACVLSGPNKEKLEKAISEYKHPLSLNGCLFTHPHPGYAQNDWEYVDGLGSAKPAFSGRDPSIKVMFSGHTHIPQTYVKTGDIIKGGFINRIHESETIMQSVSENKPFTASRLQGHISRRRDDKSPIVKTQQIQPGETWLFSVIGSGQPRDGITDTGYTVFDSESSTVTIVSLPYDYSKTMKTILKNGLHQRLAIRLSEGR